MKLGPFETEAGPGSLYVPITRDELLPVIAGEDDVGGLRAVVAALGDGPRTCDRALLAAGRALGFQPGDPPPWAVPAIGALATRLHNAFTTSPDVPPDAFDDLLHALARYVRIAPWELWRNEDIIAIEIAIGTDARRELDGSVMGAGGEEFGLALYEGRGSAAEVKAAIDAGDYGRARTIPTIGVTLDDDPVWASAAVLAGYGFPAVPHVIALGRRGQRPATGDDLHVMAAALAAVGALAPTVREAVIVSTRAGRPPIRATAAVRPVG